jgi:hypothetical protein
MFDIVEAANRALTDEDWERMSAMRAILQTVPPGPPCLLCDVVADIPAQMGYVHPVRGMERFEAFVVCQEYAARAPDIRAAVVEAFGEEELQFPTEPS